MGKNGFEVFTDELLDEEVLETRTRNGLRLRVVPTDRFRETAAVVTFRYGSTDLGFTAGDRRHESPEGVAHYLEHKLFEDEDIQAFQRFAERGAQVNAMTSFTRTSYHFTATSKVRENLKDLLGLVSRAHLTEENVEKERGIIAQEIRMYEDSPDYRLFFELLRGLYSEHPVRNPVGGTVESIQAITPEELMTCYRAFYRTGNAAMAVAGPVEPDEILELASKCGLAAGDATESFCPTDLAATSGEIKRHPADIPRAKVYLGFKDRELIAEPEARLQRQLVTEIVLDRLFAAASEIREDLRLRGVVDDSLSSAHLSDHSFGFSFIDCETDDPEATVAGLKEVLLRPVTIDEEYLERVRRKLTGRYVRSLSSVRNLAFGQVQELLENIAPFGAMARIAKVTAEDVVARQAEHLCEDGMAVVVGVPG